MKRFAILTLALVFTAACTTLRQKQTAITSLHTAAVDQLATGQTTLPEFTMADLQNAKSAYDQHYAVTGNLYDKAGSQCMAAYIAYFPTIQTLFAPASSPTPPVQVTGFFSAAAAKQIAAEDARTALAAKEALVRNGFPPEVTIACAPIRDFIGMALSHGGAQ